MENRKATGRFGNSVTKTASPESLGRFGISGEVLSPRERKIVFYLAEGNSNKQIAAVLNLSVRTVEAYRARVMRKLNFHSFAELVRYAVRNEIVEL